MTQAQKIKELEERIRALEARPVYVPIYIGQPYTTPAIPVQPWHPQPMFPWVTTGGTIGTAASSGPNAVSQGGFQGSMGVYQ